MDTLVAIFNRIGVIFSLTLKEAVRRRLILVLVICCSLFMLIGGACTRLACRGVEVAIGNQDAAAIERQEKVARQILEREKLSEEERAQVMQEIEKRKALSAERKAELDKENKKYLKFLFIGVSYAMIAFWLSLIAIVATPFLALNDFQNRTHVLLLSRPLKRWEYLSGKYLAILAMLLLNLVVLLLSYHLAMFLSVEEPGTEIYRGLVIFIQGIMLLAAMLMVAGLNVGRIPSIFIVVVIAVLSILPGLALTTGLHKDFSSGVLLLIDTIAYGTPQLGVNFFYGLGEAVDMPGVEDKNIFKKAGNLSGLYSLLINSIWFVVIWAVMIVLFKRKDLDT